MPIVYQKRRRGVNGVTDYFDGIFHLAEWGYAYPQIRIYRTTTGLTLATHAIRFQKHTTEIAADGYGVNFEALGDGWI